MKSNHNRNFKRRKKFAIHDSSSLKKFLTTKKNNRNYGSRNAFDGPWRASNMTIYNR